MAFPSAKFPRQLKRILGAAKGRPVASVMLVFMLVVNFIIEPSAETSKAPPLVKEVVNFLGKPFSGGRILLFDGYQSLAPQVARFHPVTIVAIDEKSLKGAGQWPWPRDRMADLINGINRYAPAAIGLDIYMPETDQASPERLADRLPPPQQALAQALRALPTNDQRLAEALRASPSVLGAAGFDFETYTTSAGLRSAPLVAHGADPLPHVHRYPAVLASLPELQAAARGQGLLSVDVAEGAVRRIPLLAAVGDQLVPGLAMEMLRVASGSTAVEVTASLRGISQVRVADLAVPTQPDGEVWLHFARLDAGISRYVSALDILQGRVDPEILKNKLVLVGLTGEGLSDMRTTALHEVVPGIEIQAQLIESMFGGRILRRPPWIKWLETVLIGMAGATLIWFVPRRDSRLAARIRKRPKVSLAITLGIDLAVFAAGFAVFQFHGLLFDASAFAIAFSIIMALLSADSLIEGLGEAQTKLARLVDSGIMLGREQNRSALLRQTLLVAREMAYCQAATLFIKTERGTLCLAMCTSTEHVPDLELPLLEANGKPNHHLLEAHVVNAGQTVVIDDLAAETLFDVSSTRRFGEEAGAPVTSVLNVPLKVGNVKILGMIQLINALDADTGEPIPFDPKIVGFIEALAAQAAVAIDNQNLLEAQKVLMDSMILIIAGAIDAKSPYTGGHCERVPELAIMLAEQACLIKAGPLAGFDFKTEDEWREFRIGAWLHDCGKVTTPEYVVDKASKLEIIFNRIHEVRMRFEVLLRDAQVERLQAIHERGEEMAAANAHFEMRKAELIDDFAFVAECNLGGEFMAPDRVERLRKIARNTWLRHFNDRLGLSHEELKRFEKEPVLPLPVKEPLLADKPHHLFERAPSQALDEKYGFKLKVPEYLYNHGEIYNLSIGRGTLTEEERFKINEHIIQTIVMLEQMPLPPNLKRVPEYAGTHHETLVGSGYPRGLDETKLSVPSRIMAIADIFEALTASDRPYKKAKTLSESIKILYQFKKERHIDAVLFDLLLTSGVYKTYAERYLLPEQIDDVDIEKFLG